MKNHLKRSIGRLVAVNGEGGTVRGTAFLVSECHILTAFHVVGPRAASRQAGVPMTYPAITFELDGFAGPLPVSLVPGCADPVADWALLQLGIHVTDREPIALGSPASASQDADTLHVEIWGFPSLGALAQSGILLHSELLDENAVYQQAWTYQLFSKHLVDSQTLDGLSGAPCLINDVAVGIIRANLVAPSTEETVKKVQLGILYACPIADASLQERCAALIPLADAVLGGLHFRPVDLPAEPFRYLHWYDRQHVGVYFGRDGKIQALRSRITSPDLPMVTLVYGASGVGKSSLLEAGVAPRLSRYTVALRRRETGKKLLDTFEDMLASSCHAANGGPIILMLDQLEEAYTERQGDGNAELSQLAERLVTLQDAPDAKLKVVLGFRSEWLAPIRERLAERGTQFSEFFLEPMKSGEIAQVVRGITSPHHFERYQVKVDSELPALIASDLTKDPHSPISPVLSIILTKLWKLAQLRPELPRTMSVKDYNELIRGEVNLSSFLREQIEKVRQIRPIDVDSGLVHDLLFRHITEFGTTETLSASKKQTIYNQFTKDEQGLYIDNLTEILCKHSLLYTQVKNSIVDGDGQELRIHTRLAHDTLAIAVWNEYQRSERPGQRACRLLESKASTFAPADLQIIEKGIHGMRGLSDKEQALLDRARHHARVGRRNRWLMAGTACVALLVIAASANWAFNEGETQLSKRLVSEGERLVDLKQPELGIPLALLGHAIEPSDNSYGALLRIALAIGGDVRYYGNSWINESLAQTVPAAFSQFGKVAVVNPGNSARIINLAPDADDGIIPMPELDQAKLLAISADGDCVIAAFSDNRLLQRPVPGRTCVSRDIKRGVAAANASSLAISRDRKTITVGTDRGTLEIYNTDGSFQLSLPNPRTGADAIFHTAIANEGKTIIAGTATGAVWLISNEQAPVSRLLLKHIDDLKQRRIVNAIAVDPSEKAFYVARDDDKGVFYYDLNDLDHPFPIPYPAGAKVSSIAGLAVSPNAEMLAIASWAGPIRIWDTKNRADYTNYETHTSAATHLVFIDNNHLVSWPFKGVGHAWAPQSPFTTISARFPISRAILRHKENKLVIWGKEGQISNWKNTDGRWTEIGNSQRTDIQALAAISPQPDHPGQLIRIRYSSDASTDSPLENPQPTSCPSPLSEQGFQCQLEPGSTRFTAKTASLGIGGYVCMPKRGQPIYIWSELLNGSWTFKSWPPIPNRQDSHMYTNIAFDDKCVNMAATDVTTKQLVLFKNNENLTEIRRLDRAAYQRNGLSYTHDGRWLVVAEDNYLNILNAATGKAIGRPMVRRADMITGLFIDQEDNTIFAYGEPAVDLWPTPDAAYQRLCSIPLPAVTGKQRSLLFESVLEQQLAVLFYRIGNLVRREQWQCKALQMSKILGA